MPRNLSKSRLLAFRQCPKRLWLEIHKPEVKADSAGTEASFRVGHEVGAIARQIYDPDHTGVMLDAQKDGYNAVLARSRDLLASDRPIFEAGYAAAGTVAFADVMLPTAGPDGRAWRMVEVKSSTKVKDYHRDDAAIQAFVARTAGVPLAGLAVATVDSGWTYKGDGDYRGLLVENDLTVETQSRAAEVKQWIDAAQTVAAADTEPARPTGAHCTTPYECGFLSYCRSQEPQAEHPISVLPRLQKLEVKAFIETNGLTELSDVPDEYLNDIQRRVKAHTLSGQPYFDAAQARKELASHTLPAMFMDFEAVQLAVPRWAGMHPYQQVPFQFSMHRLSASGHLGHDEFIDLSGQDPSAAFAAALVEAAGTWGPIFVYNQGFEVTRISELAARCPAYAGPLKALAARVVDLLPITRRHFYHPSQEGSWSIKKVLPAVAPDLGNL